MPITATAKAIATANIPSAAPTRSSGDAAAIRARHDVTRVARAAAGLKDLRSLIIEAELDLGQAVAAHRRAQARLLLRVEEEETAAPGADQLAAERAIGHRQVV